MAISRRDVVVGAALGGAAMVSGGAAAAGPAKEAGRVLHHVFFWLKKPGSAEDRDALMAGLRGLTPIPVVRSLALGVPAATGQRGVVDGSFDVSALMAFDSVADEKIYQDHPVHLDFVAKCQHLWDKVIVYDVATV